MSKSYKIHVPATTANVGPGFDVCGIALSFSLTVEVTIPSQSGSNTTANANENGNATLPVITYTGLDSSNVPLSPYKNLLTRVALYVLRSHNIPTFPSGVTIHAHNQIPFGRGLGSSGAAVIAGVLLGDLLGDLHLPKERLLDFALMVERHPDNVTAALIGGFVGSYLRELSPEDSSAASVPLAEVLPEYPPDAGPQWGTDPPKAPVGIGHYIKYGWAKEIKAIAVMPRFELATAKARGVLPDTYSRKDMVCCLYVCSFPAPRAARRTSRHRGSGFDHPLPHPSFVFSSSSKWLTRTRSSISNAWRSSPPRLPDHHPTPSSSLKQ